MRLRTSVLCLALAAPLVAGCGIFESDEWAERRRALERSRDRWTDELAHTYRYTLAMSCECIAGFVGPVAIEVADQRITSLVPLHQDAEVPDEEWWSAFVTVDDMFALIDSAITRRAHQFDVRYDPLLGHPTRIVLDFDRQYVDDELAIQVSDLEIVARFGTWE